MRDLSCIVTRVQNSTFQKIVVGGIIQTLKINKSFWSGHIKTEKNLCNSDPIRELGSNKPHLCVSCHDFPRAICI